MTPDRPKSRTGPKLVVGLAVVMLLPLTLIFVVFPLFASEPFTSVEELEPENIASLRVQLLNRQGIDDGPDVGPYSAKPGDVPGLLDALRSAPEVENFDGARGPWLGEYRVVTKTGRRGTVRFYWQPAMAPGGSQTLRYKIGERKFEGGDLKRLIAAIEEVALGK